MTKHVQALVRAAVVRETERLSTPARLRYKVERLYRYQRRTVRRAVSRQLRSDAALARAAEAFADVAGVAGRVLVVGAGHGAAAHWLAERYPRLQVRGVVEEGEPLRAARRSAAGTPRVSFEALAPATVHVPAADGALVDAPDPASLEALVSALAATLPAGAPVAFLREGPGHDALLARAGLAPHGPPGCYVRGRSA